MADKNLIPGNSMSNNVEALARKIKKEAPKLQELDKETLEAIAKIVITQRLTDELNEKINLADIDYKMEKNIFIMACGRTGSDYTHTAYLKSLKALETYCKSNNINILLMNYAQADDFIYSLQGSPNSKRLTIAAISSFYTFLERRNANIKNPVRGTRARPEKKPVKKLEIPTDNEVNIILNSVPEPERLAVYIMAFRGLRIGALRRLTIWGNTYTSVSKGKQIYGEFSPDILKQVKKSDLNNKTPFSDYSVNALKLRIYRQTQKLFNDGKISSAFSAHDFRHYFAVSEYQKDQDIYKLCQLLDHSNISITENYLKSIRIK
jgi:site-specific recombinase XerD